MAEELLSGKDIAGIIPGVYYDLIARVSAGVPFLTVLLWDKRDHFKIGESSAVALLLFVLGAYLVGIVFSSCSGLFMGATKLMLAKRTLDKDAVPK